MLQSLKLKQTSRQTVSAKCFVLIFALNLVIASSTGIAQTVLFDFGRHDNTHGSTITGALPVNGVTVGSATAIGDTVSYTWNSIGTGTNNQVLGNPTYSGFKDQAGGSVGWSIGNIQQSWTQANGFQNGGLSSAGTLNTRKDPSFSLLGKYAVANVTGDYWFVDNTLATTGPASRAGFTISGLDPSLSYTFNLFGSRHSTSARYTHYFLEGSNRGYGLLQTSGSNIGSGDAGSIAGNLDTGKYDGNDANILTISGVNPTSAGNISLAFFGTSTSASLADTPNANGNSFGYLNFMEVSAVPEPSGVSLFAAGLIGLWATHRRRA
jgi:hypothetical protein